MRLELADVRPHDAELHRICHRRAEWRTEGACAQADEVFVENLALSRLMARSRPGDVLGQNDELDKVGPEQLLVKRQVVTRRSVADISHIG